MRVKGNIVYVSNKPFMSDFNALQLEPARIRQMSLSNPTADGLSTPTAWQPPLPPDVPPPLPDQLRRGHSTHTMTTSTRTGSIRCGDSPTILRFRLLPRLDQRIHRSSMLHLNTARHILCISHRRQDRSSSLSDPSPHTTVRICGGYEVTNRVHSGRCTSYHQDAKGIVCVYTHTQL